MKRDEYLWAKVSLMGFCFYMKVILQKNFFEILNCILQKSFFLNSIF